jgi:hypothetical protein
MQNNLDIHLLMLNYLWIWDLMLLFLVELITKKLSGDRKISKWSLYGNPSFMQMMMRTNKKVYLLIY